MNQKAQRWVWRFGPRNIPATMPLELTVTASAVYGWVKGRTSPSYKYAKALVDAAKADTVHGGKKDRLTVDDFLEPHVELDPAELITLKRNIGRKRTTTTTKETSNADRP